MAIAPIVTAQAGKHPTVVAAIRARPEDRSRMQLLRER